MSLLGHPSPETAWKVEEALIRALKEVPRGFIFYKPDEEAQVDIWERQWQKVGRRVAEISKEKIVDSPAVFMQALVVRFLEVLIAFRCTNVNQIFAPFQG